MATEKLSPGMQQYVDIKKQYPDAFLLFRMGDFYELFYEDAINAAQILEISLTSRNKNAENPIPMAGVPYHSAQQYIDVLIEQGYKVAIAEQMEDPKQAVGVVKREVVQVITPGTVVDSSKPDSQNNFLVAIDRDGNQFGLAYMDLVTGDFYVTGLLDFTLVCGEIRNLKAREVVLGYDLSEEEKQIFSRQMNLVLSYEKEGFEGKFSQYVSYVAGGLVWYSNVKVVFDLKSSEPNKTSQYYLWPAEMRIDVGTHVYAVNGQSKPVSAKEQKHSMNAVFRGEYIDGVWQIGTLGSLQSS